MGDKTSLFQLATLTLLLASACIVRRGVGTPQIYGQIQVHRISLYTALTAQVQSLKQHNDLPAMDNATSNVSNATDPVASIAPTPSPSMPKRLNAAERKHETKVQLAQAQVKHDNVLYKRFSSQLEKLDKNKIDIEAAMKTQLSKDRLEVQAAEAKVHAISAVSSSKKTAENATDHIDAEDSLTTHAQHLARTAKLDKAAAKVLMDQGKAEVKDAASMEKNDPMRAATSAQAKQMLHKARRELSAAEQESKQSKQLFVSAMHSASRAAAESKRQAQALKALNAAVDAQQKAKGMMKNHKRKFRQKLAAVKSTGRLIKQEMQTTSVQTQLDEAIVVHQQKQLHKIIVHAANASSAASHPVKKLQATPPSKKKSPPTKLRATVSKHLHGTSVSDFDASLSNLDSDAGESPAEKHFIKEDVNERERQRPKVNSYGKLEKFIRSRDKLLDADDTSSSFSIPTDRVRAALPLNFGA
jgi:hypothetical protein